MDRAQQMPGRTVQLLGARALRREVLRGRCEALGGGRQIRQRARQRLQPRGHAREPLARRIQARGHVDECMVVRDGRVLLRMQTFGLCSRESSQGCQGMP